MFFIVRPRFAGLFLCVLFALLIITRMAFAQSVAPGAAPTTVDLSFWVNLTMGVAWLVVPGVAVFVGKEITAHFHIAKDSAAANVIDLGVTALTQFAASEMAAHPPAYRFSLQSRNEAITKALAQLSDGTQAAMKARGITAAAIAQRIDGALLLAGQGSATPPAVVPPATPVST